MHPDLAIEDIRELMLVSLDKSKKFKEIELPTTGEICWNGIVPQTQLMIQVRSGITNNGKTLPKVDRGLRIFIIDIITQTPVIQPIRVRRRGKFTLDRLREQIGALWIQARKLKYG